MVRENQVGSWNDRWENEDFAPFWLTNRIPEPVGRALESGLIRAGSSVLEIGCGRGHLAAHLAENGLRVLAIDSAEAAISRAIAEFGRVKGALSYEVVDFVEHPVGHYAFDNAIDCGCFHAIPVPAKQRYAANLSRCLKAGGHFLLMHKTTSATFKDKIADEDIPERILTYFEQDFEICSIDHMTFGNEELRILGVAITMRRR